MIPGTGMYHPSPDSKQHTSLNQNRVFVHVEFGGDAPRRPHRNALMAGFAVKAFLEVRVVPVPWDTLRRARSPAGSVGGPDASCGGWQQTPKMCRITALFFFNLKLLLLLVLDKRESGTMFERNPFPPGSTYIVERLPSRELCELVMLPQLAGRNGKTRQLLCR